MTNIKIVTDSTADLPASLVNQYNIHVIPLKVIFDTAIYREGIDITTEQFYQELAKSQHLPTTSQPSPGEFQKLYEELTGDGSTVISIHISAQMSGTYQSAIVAKNTLPDRDIRVIDSKLVSMGLGLVVLAAARAAKDNKTADEIVSIVDNVAKQIKIYFIVDSLENLHKGGRIGKASALLGTVLNIKPVLSVEDGVVTSLEKVRGKGKALERIAKLVKDYAANKGITCCVVLHANSLDDAVIFHKKLISQIESCENIIGDMGAVVGTHAGAGTMGVIFY